MSKSEVWVKIKHDVFREEKFEDIAFIIQILSWKPSNSIDKAYFFVEDGYEESDNFKQLSKVYQELLTLQADDAVVSGNSEYPKYIITKKKNRNANEFVLEEAIRFFLTTVIL
jgi:hypothetical protein